MFFVVCAWLARVRALVDAGREMIVSAREAGHNSPARPRIGDTRNRPRRKQALCFFRFFGYSHTRAHFALAATMIDRALSWLRDKREPDVCSTPAFRQVCVGRTGGFDGEAAASCFLLPFRPPPSLRPQSFAAFLDAFADTVHAGGLAAVRPATSTLRPGPPVLPAAPRVIAVGDLHGDAAKARRALRLAGVLGPDDRWCGGGSVVVQVGDILDRGDGELALLHLLERLSNEAAAAGGAVHTLHGNHETLNVAGRFRYATRGGSEAFARRAAVEALAAAWKRRCGCDGGGDGADMTGLTTPIALDEVSTRAAATPARAAALRPGGPVTTRFLAPSRVILQVGSSVFVHGGVLPSHGVHGAAGMAAINDNAAAWMRGEPSHPTMPPILGGRDAVVWARDYSHEDAASCDCECVGVGWGGW